MNPTQLLCASSLATALLLSSCSQASSGCSDAQTTGVVKDIYRDSIRKVLSNISPELLPKMGEIESMTQVEVQAIRTVAKDESVGRVTCEANLVVRIPAELAKTLSTSLASISLGQESVKVNGNQLERDIRYTSQLTDDKKQVQVEVTGVSSVAQLIAMSSVSGLLKPDAQAPKLEEQKPIAATGPSPRASAATEVPSKEAARASPADSPDGSAHADPETEHVAGSPAAPEPMAATLQPNATGPMKPSFPCDGKLTATEQMICGTPMLAEADARLSASYKSALEHSGDPAVVKQRQREWRKSRDTCADAACILSAYETRNAELVK